MNQPATNPLLDFADLPRFDEIAPRHVADALDVLLSRAETAVAAAEKVTPVTWKPLSSRLNPPMKRSTDFGARSGI